MPDLWPFQPLSDCGEAWVWNTDVRTAYSAEMRDSLSEARQTVSYRYRLTAEEHAVAIGLVESQPYGDWYLPMWFEATQSGDVASTDTTLTCDTAASYEAGGYVVVWQDRSTYAVCEISTVGSGALTLAAAVGANLTAPYIAPLRTAFAPSGMEFERQFHDDVIAGVVFYIRDPVDTAASPFSSYSGLDVVTDLSLAVSPVAGSLRQVVELVDSGFGPIAAVPRRSVIDNIYGLNWEDETISAKARRRKWLCGLRGKDSTFWMPSRSREMVVTAPIGAADTTISIRPVLPDIASYIGKHISIAGTIYREITSAVVSGSNHVLTIAATGVALTDPEICFLRKYRLDTDQVEIAHSGPRARGAATLREVSA
ncbi:hypothetical protein [Actibacterium sp. MT2.3-13A]|uniref:hypothetical protein n=1 Tax=Actibacterium sp. MT2.3-13A TaxID=2828332 RepID=UPI001BAA2A18|nr:hypothetical protein [Actibacterium sp. MT2.3-13A]